MLKYLAPACVLWACTDTSPTAGSIVAAPLLGSTAPTLLYSTTRPPETATYAQLPSLAFRISDPTSTPACSWRSIRTAMGR